ncbi:MAG: F0F1 ATP synthase subunit A [Alphaproteobacteria bacterium]|nr:F0F1 ATP synthase subunit A [Alphaproteobacteria bacterium]
MHSPIEQFNIKALSSDLFEIGGYPVAFTNSALFMVLAVFLATLFMVLTMKSKSLVPGRWQMLAEMIYNGIGHTLLEAAGDKAKPFLPFIMSIFMFVLFCNLFGMIPYSFTVTSHIVINFALSMTVIFVVLVTGFIKHGAHFVHLFMPSGVPKLMLPFISLIELVSFFIRPCSLAIRLFANMLAGHILLKVFAGMTAGLATAGWAAPIGVLPVVANVVIVAFEFFVAILQAYIFTILSAVYLRDALEMH